MGPAVIAASAVQINVMVNASFASHQGNGAVTWLNNAFRLMQLPLGVFGVAIATVTLPLVSKSAALGDMAGFRSTLARALRLAFFLTIPSAIGLICLGGPIISLLYQHGRFTAEAAQQTGAALQFYAIGLAAYSGIKVLAPAFYALDARTTPMTVSFIAIGINVVLNGVFTHALGWGHRRAGVFHEPDGDHQFYPALRADAPARRATGNAADGASRWASWRWRARCWRRCACWAQRYALGDFYHFGLARRCVSLFGDHRRGGGGVFRRRVTCCALEEMQEAVGLFARRLRRRKRVGGRLPTRLPGGMA